MKLRCLELKWLPEPTVTHGHIQNSGALVGPLLVFSLMRAAMNARHRSITIDVTVITGEEASL